MALKPNKAQSHIIFQNKVAFSYLDIQAKPRTGRNILSLSVKRTLDSIHGSQ